MQFRANQEGDPGPHDSDPDGADLPVIGPHAGVDGVSPQAVEAHVRARLDDDLLEGADEPDHVRAMGQVHDGVAHQLPRPVERHAPAAIDPTELGPGGAHGVLGPPEVGRVPHVPAVYTEGAPAG